MPKIILQGYCRKAGSFADKETGTVIEYDNIVLEVTSDVPLQTYGVKEQGGSHVNEIKVKYNLMKTIFVPALNSVSDLSAWCGKEIACTYVPQGDRNVIAEVRLLSK